MDRRIVMKQPITTLCYIEKDDAYLMLHRIKKKNDVNAHKWIGIGGHVEFCESPEDCLLREAMEETGLTLTSYKFRGLITFIFNNTECEYMCLYTADSFEGKLIECNEGTLEWVPKENISQLNLWVGDLLFFRLLRENSPFFSMKLCYENDTLISWQLNGKDWYDRNKDGTDPLPSDDKWKEILDSIR